MLEKKDLVSLAKVVANADLLIVGMVKPLIMIHLMKLSAKSLMNMLVLMPFIVKIKTLFSLLLKKC